MVKVTNIWQTGPYVVVVASSDARCDFAIISTALAAEPSTLVQSLDICSLDAEGSLQGITIKILVMDAELTHRRIFWQS